MSEKRQEVRNLETIPVGSLGLIPLESCRSLGEKVDQYLVKWRTERESEHKDSLAFAGYQRDTYILDTKVPRFGSGEAKGVINESVRGDDLYLMVDVCNHSLTYSLSGNKNRIKIFKFFNKAVNIPLLNAGKKPYFCRIRCMLCAVIQGFYADKLT